MKTLTYLRKGATISNCGLYRYHLWRYWGDGLRLIWVMLNPSTADAEVDDPTIRRCVGFALNGGYDGIEVVNLFALRSPNPKDLRAWIDDGLSPVGPGNDRILRDVCNGANPVVAAWGAQPFARERATQFENELTTNRLLCLGKTKDGFPKHPLYVAASTPLVQYLA